MAYSGRPDMVLRFPAQASTRAHPWEACERDDDMKRMKLETFRALMALSALATLALALEAGRRW